MGEGIDGSTGSTTFECHCKNKENWIGRKFSLSQHRLLSFEIYEEVFCVHVTLSKHVTNNGSQSGFPCYNLTISHREASPICSSEKRRVVLWVRFQLWNLQFQPSLIKQCKQISTTVFTLVILRVQYIGQFDLFIVYIQAIKG